MSLWSFIATWFPTYFGFPLTIGAVSGFLVWWAWESLRALSWSTFEQYFQLKLFNKLGITESDTTKCEIMACEGLYITILIGSGIIGGIIGLFIIIGFVIHALIIKPKIKEQSKNLPKVTTPVLDFDVKRRYFRTELERLDEGVRREDLAVHVGRSNVFEDSFRQLQRRSAEEWKNRFKIVFEGEEGQDAGGLLREWYVIISREIFNPMYALFTISPGDRITYMIDPSSHCNSNHLCYFKFVGRVIAKAIYDNKLLECYFTRSFYKHVLGKPLKYMDMESEDYKFYQKLVLLMENSVNDLGYNLTFSTEVKEFGVTEVRDLIPNGANIPVTEENKMEYVRLVCQMKMTGAIRQQLNAFVEGFYDIIPKRLISIFNEQELELLVSGLPKIDIDDLKANTEYHKYEPDSLQIPWFWTALRSFDKADKAKFLQFVTGTSKVPPQGFSALEGMNGVQKFQIHRDDRSTDRLQSAHTCFNRLDLPEYETYGKLRKYLLKAIHECSEGLGWAAKMKFSKVFNLFNYMYKLYRK